MCMLPEGKATAVCAQRAKGVGSLSFHVKLLASSRQASQSTCIKAFDALTACPVAGTLCLAQCT